MTTHKSEAAEPDATVAKKRRRSGSEKRKEQRVRTLRLSEKQNTELEKNAAAAGVSVSGFIRRRCCTAQDVKPRKIIPMEVQELVRLRGKVGMVGNNLLHQVVKRENFRENPHAEDYYQAIVETRAVIASIHAILRDAHRRMAG